jgi:hypothetical protein
MAMRTTAACKVWVILYLKTSEETDQKIYNKEVDS